MDSVKFNMDRIYRPGTVMSLLGTTKRWDRNALTRICVWIHGKGSGKGNSRLYTAREIMVLSFILLFYTGCLNRPEYVLQIWNDLRCLKLYEFKGFLVGRFDIEARVWDWDICSSYEVVGGMPMVGLNLADFKDSLFFPEGFLA